MGLQLHRLDRFRKSKWRTQFDYVSLQHQTQYQYTGRSRLDCQTPQMEQSLQEKVLVFTKNDLFTAEIRLCL